MVEANYVMTTVQPVAMVREKSTKSKEENITVRGKFKTVNLYNDTIHIILYPHDGLSTAARLLELEEGTNLTLKVTEERF